MFHVFGSFGQFSSVLFWDSFLSVGAPKVSMEFYDYDGLGWFSYQ